MVMLFHMQLFHAKGIANLSHVAHVYVLVTYDIDILILKVKVLLLYSAARPDGFSSTLQHYPWQGTHPTLV